MRLFKKNKKPKRPIFGFPCSLPLADDIRYLSRELTLPIYPIAEHGLGLGCVQIAVDLRDEDSRKALYNHLLEEHFLSPVFDIDNNYDMRAAIGIRKRQLRHWELDRFAHQLVYMVEREGIPIKLIMEATYRLVEHVRRKRSKNT
ncbi:MAG: hypothetical protein KAV87_59255 [Desulfobacteraceae bacterium]|nr:hypothetical protein [Desulfobacteraceae bacterium]